ncbi:glycosyltransferase family 4 protein [Desulfobotulus sp. H1]|uniref:Glycosyltransferase family 4 protein n=1 Tax=Desulfobotulus pelophilus TaxID=2823377 RepID=A0ABT3NC61_9BACT|nr:glycosyltransferase family 4 protein [Desulfobotulus pelophilus]MCW7755061.1 glycosyltransferase family 4 protein [Desulfobotulus pelophilus]
MNKESFLADEPLTRWNEKVVRIRLLFFMLLFPFRLVFQGADIVHANPSMNQRAILRDGIFILMSKIFRKKILVFIHGWDDREFEKISTCRLRKFLFLKVYNYSDLLVVLSEQFSEKLLKIGINKEISVETTMLDESFIVDAEIKKKIDNLFDKKTINILFLSRIEKTKGIYEAIDAYTILKSKGFDVALTVAGDGNELAKIKLYVSGKKIQNVTFAGFVSGRDKHRVFMRGDVFLFPTYFEGMPISMLEVMAYGMPVISRSVGGIPSVLSDGINGFMTYSKDPEIFSSFVIKLLENRCLFHSIARNNARLAKEKFYSAVVGKRIEKRYENLLGENIPKSSECKRLS